MKEGRRQWSIDGEQLACWLASAGASISRVLVRLSASAAVVSEQLRRCKMSDGREAGARKK